MDKKIIGLVGIIIAMVLIFVAFFMPIYSYSTSMDTEELSGFGSFFEDFDVDYNMYLTKMEVKGSIWGMDMTNTTSYSDAEGQFPAKSVFDNTFYLWIITLILAIVSLIGFIALYLTKKNVMKKIALVFGILAFVFALIVPLYFMVGFNDFIDNQYESYLSMSEAEDTGFEYSFWFSASENGMEASGGPGIAWYIMFIAGIIALISSIMLMLNKKEKMKLEPQY